MAQRIRFEDSHRFGFDVIGDHRNDRRLIDWPAAFVGYCGCDERAEVCGESYLSAFQFGDDFRQYLERTGSTRNYKGETWSRWLWFDVDRDDIENATMDVRKLAANLCRRYMLDGDELLAFFSGSKGFHLGLPLAVCGTPEPAETFNQVCRRFAETLAGAAKVAIDSSIYDAVRLFRSPNSRHPKTGLHKRRLTFDELLNLSTRRIVELAAEPDAFDLPNTPVCCDAAVRDWTEAVDTIQRERVAIDERRRDGRTPERLNRSTVEFMREPPTQGDRHRLLFSAAANLAEFGCSFELAFALLSESALDSGLSPSDVRRQIECGLNHQKT